jgi:hypothetical protein
VADHSQQDAHQPNKLIVADHSQQDAHQPNKLIVADHSQQDAHQPNKLIVAYKQTCNLNDLLQRLVLTLTDSRQATVKKAINTVMIRAINIVVKPPSLRLTVLFFLKTVARG